MSALMLLQAAAGNDDHIVAALFACVRVPLSQDVADMIAEPLWAHRHARMLETFYELDLDIRDIQESLEDASNTRERVEIMRAWIESQAYSSDEALEWETF